MTATLQNIQEKMAETLLLKMQGLGIKRNCRDWSQYSKAKKLVEDLAFYSSDYDRLNRIAVDYINI